MVSDIAGKPEEYPLWRLENGDLFKRVFLPYPDLEEDSDGWLRVIPIEERRALISAHHDPPIFGHLGVQKTYARLASKFYWPKMKEDVARYVRNCDICLKAKPIQQAPVGLMLGHGPTATRPFEVVSIDLVGPLPRSTSGFQYIVTMVDVFSKFVLFFPLRSATSAKVAQIFEDQLGYIANYHAQANPVERTHRVVKTILSAYVQENHRSWEKYLQKVACAIRSARHETTQLDPNFIVFGRRLKFSGAKTLPQDVPKQNLVQEMETRCTVLKKVFADVYKRLQRASVTSSARYNLRRRDERFAIGQKVSKKKYTLSNKAKGLSATLNHKFEGPFTVTRIVSPWSYELKDSSNRSIGVWHASDLKAHPPDSLD
nr:unnamed protein product [Callosobruchus analis]